MPIPYTELNGLHGILLKSNPCIPWDSIEIDSTEFARIHGISLIPKNHIACMDSMELHAMGSMEARGIHHIPWTSWNAM